MKLACDGFSELCAGSLVLSLPDFCCKRGSSRSHHSERVGMSATRFALVSLVATAALVAAACSGNPPEKTIKSNSSGDLTVTLSNSTGELRSGENDLFISFRDASGKLIDVGAASLNFQMASMGTMPEMNNKAALTTTEAPGKYRATVEIEMAGTWEGVISYDGSHGKGQVRLTVNVK
jgi:hypothetical protein